jgi:uncharacterized protein (UPF0261 family)
MAPFFFLSSDRLVTIFLTSYRTFVRDDDLLLCLNISIPFCFISGFMSGFKNLDSSKVLFMQSDGGLVSVHSFTGCRAILSGPAGGVVAIAHTAFDKDTRTPVIGFDMGGTSTDVRLIANRMLIMKLLLIFYSDLVSF